MHVYSCMQHRGEHGAEAAERVEPDEALRALRDGLSEDVGARLRNHTRCMESQQRAEGRRTVWGVRCVCGRGARLGDDAVAEREPERVGPLLTVEPVDALDGERADARLRRVAERAARRTIGQGSSRR